MGQRRQTKTQRDNENRRKQNREAQLVGSLCRASRCVGLTKPNAAVLVRFRGSGPAGG